MKISETYEWKRISPNDPEHEYMFGYYDRNPWNPSKTLHLALRIPVLDGIPKPGETADVGVLDLSGDFRKYVTTRTWCHQQGCMELFLPGKKDTFIYNDINDAGKCVAKIYEIGKGNIGEYPCPIYAISPNGKYGVSLNFGRIPRRGYSYAETPVPEDRHPADPDAEGIFLVDMESKQCRLIVSYSEMMKHHPYAYGSANRYQWLNHAIFNCDSTRLLWLFRECLDEHTLAGGWTTYMYTSDLNGSDVECVLPQPWWNRMISHQIWGRTPREILVDANWDGTGHHAIVFDESIRPFKAKKIGDSHGAMSHMVFSPDKQWLLADSYPLVNGVRNGTAGEQLLLLIDPLNGNSELLGTFDHHWKGKESCPGDLRCDLHPRWDKDSALCTVDSFHEDGLKRMFFLDLSEAKQKLMERRG